MRWPWQPKRRRVSIDKDLFIAGAKAIARLPEPDRRAALEVLRATDDIYAWRLYKPALPEILAKGDAA